MTKMKGERLCDKSGRYWERSFPRRILQSLLLRIILYIIKRRLAEEVIYDLNGIAKGKNGKWNVSNPCLTYSRQKFALASNKVCDS